VVVTEIHVVWIFEAPRIQSKPGPKKGLRESWVEVWLLSQEEELLPDSLKQ
jgi:hypothetical protein